MIYSRTYGYARFEILAAAMNALILMAVAFIFFMRLINDSLPS